MFRTLVGDRVKLMTSQYHDTSSTNDNNCNNYFVDEMFRTLVEWQSDMDTDDGTIYMTTSPVAMAMNSLITKCFARWLIDRVMLLTSKYHDTINTNGNNYPVYEMFLTLVEWPSDVDIDDGTICMTSPVVMVMNSLIMKCFALWLIDRVMLLTSKYHDSISSNGNNSLVYVMLLTLVEWYGYWWLHNMHDVTSKKCQWFSLFI